MEVSQTSHNSRSSNDRLLAKFRRRAQRLKKRAQHLATQLDATRQRHQQTLEELQVQRQKVAIAQSQGVQVTQHPINSPVSPFRDPPIFQHHFAASMVALCVNLARILPLRTVPKTLELILPALGIQTKIPDRETISRWSKRIGLNRLMQNQTATKFRHHKDMIWMVDHSNQIGIQKVLVILGIPASKLPSKGKTLCLDALEVLAIEPGHSWTRDDVRRVYKQLAEKIGPPRWVLCDGAVELRESTDVLRSEQHVTDVLRDFKHVAANRFGSLIGKSKRFCEFLAEMGKTRCLVQQSNLAHLTPPGLKTKARFMNIEPAIAWATVVLQVLNQPDDSHSGVDDHQKLEKCFGWLREFSGSIASWHRCCRVIEWSLAWVNTQGIERDTAKQMRVGLADQLKDGCALSATMTHELLKSVEQSCGCLGEGERSWLSSESLESVFGLYKRREGQQSRSGFTGLVLSIPTLLRTWTANDVRTALKQTSTKELAAWTEQNIGSTVWSKRTRAYNHFSPQLRHAMTIA